MVITNEYITIQVRRIATISTLPRKIVHNASSMILYLPQPLPDDLRIGEHIARASDHALIIGVVTAQDCPIN